MEKIDDIKAYLKEHENKQLLRFITCGNVDDGKSTLIGRLLHDSKGIFEDQLENIKKDSRIKIVFFLGSSIGNLDDEMATEFIYQLGSHLSKGDKILLGVDLKKSKDVILPAYNDSQGITAEFNLNLLDRINNELGANFDRSKFVHNPVYDEEVGMAISYLKSLCDQSIVLDGKIIKFTKDELIHTEISRKYDDTIMRKILSKTDMRWEYKVTDSKKFFANYILERK